MIIPAARGHRMKLFLYGSLGCLLVAGTLYAAASWWLSDSGQGFQGDQNSLYSDSLTGDQSCDKKVLSVDQTFSDSGRGNSNMVIADTDLKFPPLESTNEKGTALMKPRGSKQQPPATVEKRAPQLQNLGISAEELKKWFNKSNEDRSMDLSQQAVEGSDNFVFLFKDEFYALSNSSEHSVSILKPYLPEAIQSVSDLLGINNLTFRNAGNAVLFMKIAREWEEKNLTNKLGADVLKEACIRLGYMDGEQGRNYATQFCGRFFPDRQLRINFDDMKLVIKLKHDQNKEVQKILKSTGDRFLINGNNWGDHFWGMSISGGSFKGQNKLGRIWHEIRQLSKVSSSNGQKEPAFNNISSNRRNISRLEFQGGNVQDIASWYEDQNIGTKSMDLPQSLVENSECFVPFFGGIKSFDVKENEFSALSNYSDHPVKISSEQDRIVHFFGYETWTFKNAESAVHFLKIVYAVAQDEVEYKHKIDDEAYCGLYKKYSNCKAQDGKDYAKLFCSYYFKPNIFIPNDYMRLVIRLKHEQNKEVQEALKNTGDLYLIEGNQWHDKRWGMFRNGGYYTGENKLGRMWYQLKIKMGLVK